MSKSIRWAILPIIWIPLSGCAIWNSIRPLNDEEERALAQYQTNARQYYETGHYPQAMQQAQKGLELSKNDRSLTFVLAWTHLKLETRNDVWRAEELFSKIDSNPWFSKQDWGTVLGHGLAYRRQGDFISAGAERAMSESFTDGAKKDLAARLHREADEKYAQAAERLERALELNPDGTDALDGLQQIYALAGDYEKSLAFGNRFIDVAGKSRPLWERQLARPDVSAEDEKVIRAKIDSNRRREVASRSLAANCLVKVKRFDDAARQLDAILDLDPAQANEYYNRGFCRAELNDKSGAVSDLEQFLRKTPLGYESKEVKKAYAKIAELNGTAPSEAGAGK